MAWIGVIVAYFITKDKPWYYFSGYAAGAATIIGVASAAIYPYKKYDLLAAALIYALWGFAWSIIILGIKLLYNKVKNR